MWTLIWIYDMNIWLCDICVLISKGLREILISSHQIKSVGCKKQKCLQNPVIWNFWVFSTSYSMERIGKQLSFLPLSPFSFVASRNEDLFYHDNIPTHHHLLFLMLRCIKICLAELFSEVGLHMADNSDGRHVDSTEWQEIHQSQSIFVGWIHQ